MKSALFVGRTDQEYVRAAHVGARKFIDWVKGEAAESITSFAVPLEDELDGARAGAFIPNQVYLEVRVLQIWLTRQRELWRDFQPFGAVVSEFIHRGEQRTLPVILGSSELSGKLTLIGERDAIEIRNLRVGGPTPYEGDDVTLLLALFRMQTGDWLGRWSFGDGTACTSPWPSAGGTR